LVAHHTADADPAWLGERFQTGRDIHTIAKDVIVLDDVVTLVMPTGTRCGFWPRSLCPAR
jgi:hypothetical protein